MSEIDVELKNVTKRFGDVVAVDDVSFTIKKGEFFSLLGPSGCGKTTILRMISGFETPTQGELHIRGENMVNRAPFKRPTNLVFQHLSLFPHMTVSKNIAFGLEMSNHSNAEIERKVGNILELIHLPGHGNRKINQLSGGQQQRVAIARALVNEPTVLLLDEPLGALDLKLREQMQLELKRIQREVGTTFVYVTHDQKEAITMSDSIAVINEGKVEQINNADAIYENPATAFVANFIGETNLFNGDVISIEGERGVIASDEITILVTAGEGVRAGQSVHVSVRPEKIRIDTKLTDLPNIYDGIVEEVIYQGASSNYKVRTSHGREMSVAVQNSELHGGFKEGEPVQVGWELEKGVVITGGVA